MAHWACRTAWRSRSRFVNIACWDLTTSISGPRLGSSMICAPTWARGFSRRQNDSGRDGIVTRPNRGGLLSRCFRGATRRISNGCQGCGSKPPAAPQPHASYNLQRTGAGDVRALILLAPAASSGVQTLRDNRPGARADWRVRRFASESAPIGASGLLPFVFGVSP